MIIKYVQRVIYVCLGISLHPDSVGTGHNGISIINASGRDITFIFERQANTGVTDKDFTNCFFQRYEQAESKGSAPYNNSMTITTTTINQKTQQSEPKPFVFFMKPDIGNNGIGGDALCEFKTTSTRTPFSSGCQITWDWYQRHNPSQGWVYALNPSSITVDSKVTSAPSMHDLFEKCGVIVSCPGGIRNGSASFDHNCRNYDNLPYDTSKFDDSTAISVITFMNVPAHMDSIQAQHLSQSSPSKNKKAKNAKGTKERIVDKNPK